MSRNARTHGQSRVRAQSPSGWTSVLDHVPDCVGVFRAVLDERGELDFRIEHVNAPACRELGESRDVLVGRLVSDALSVSPGFLGACRAAFLGEATLDLQPAPEGLHVEKSEEGVVATWRPGSVALLSEARPETRSAASQAQRAQLEAICDAMSDGLMVFDPDGRAVVVNDAIARLIGYSNAATMRRDPEYFKEAFQLFELDGRPLPLEEWPAVRVLRGEIINSVELGVRRKDTGQEWIIRFSGQPVRDAGGQILLGVVLSSDVTEQLRREQALRASELRFRALADSMPQLVWTSSTDGVVDYYNARAIEYAGLEQLPDGSWRWQPVLHPDDLQRTVDAWNRAVSTGEEYECEHRVRMSDGALRWHVSRARRVREEGIERWFGTATDIHEQKIAQDHLRRAVATRDQIVSVVVHDLRNPLTVIRTSTPVVRKVLAAAADPQTRHHSEVYLARIDRQVTKMEKLAAELLDAAQLQAGQPLDLDRRPCDLVALVRDLVDEAATTAAKHFIRLVASPSPLVGEWDPARIERVVENLLSNAIKYSALGSDVLIEVERDQEKAVVRVSDHGVGISEKDQPRIFDWFARGENAEGTARGTGVGLAGALRIVEQHGGTLTVASEVGVGSTFTVHLPLRAPNLDGEDASSP